MFVFVCVPSTPAAVLDMGMCFPVDTFSSTPIGYLNGFSSEVLSCDDAPMVERELAAYDIRVRYLAWSVKAKSGCRNAMTALAVEVPTSEAALELPGFVPFGDLSKSFYIIPEDASRAVFSFPDDEFEGMAIKRVRVSDNFEAPPYREDGSFDLSMIPQGMLGGVYFFRDDPLHYYVTSGICSDDDATRQAVVRRFMDKCRA